MIRNTPPYKASTYQEEYSTGYKLPHEIQQSRQQYQQLLEQNNYLKEQLRLRNSQPARHERQRVYSPAELQKISQSMVSGQQITPAIQPTSENIVIEKVCPYELGERSNMAMYNIIHRNKYLERKIEKLREEYQRQSKKIYKLTDRLKSHTACNRDCYEQKYYELLNMTSPN